MEVSTAEIVALLQRIDNLTDRVRQVEHTATVAIERTEFLTEAQLLLEERMNLLENNRTKGN